MGSIYNSSVYTTTVQFLEEVLQWLRGQEPPCPLDEGTCSAAAEGGHLEVLQWLRGQEPPCPWNEETCWCAAHY